MQPTHSAKDSDTAPIPTAQSCCVSPNNFVHVIPVHDQILVEPAPIESGFVNGLFTLVQNTL